MGLRIVLWYAPKEIQCPTHGRVQEETSVDTQNRPLMDA